MKTYNDNQTLDSFNPWAGAIKTKEIIVMNSKSEEFDLLIEELYPEGLSETLLNDILWFESDWVFESLGIKIED